MREGRQSGLMRATKYYIVNVSFLQNVKTYYTLSSGWCKGLLVFCGIITGCYFCCCCFCFCCNFCCGRYKNLVDEEYAEGYEDFKEGESESQEDVVTDQPTSEKTESTAFAMPPPPSYDSVNTSEKEDVITEQPSSGGAIPMPPPSMSNGNAASESFSPQPGADEEKTQMITPDSQEIELYVILKGGIFSM